MLVESDGHLYAGCYLDLPQLYAKATAVYAETMDLKYAEIARWFNTVLISAWWGLTVR